MAEIVRVVNKESQNLHAEMLLRLVGLKLKGEGSAQKGHQAIAEFLTRLGVPAEDWELRDGSGLARTDLVTPRGLAALLVAMDAHPEAAAFRASLPVAGVDGTLAKLEALIHPDFSDEEIRREVCNMGYTIDPVDASIRLEEKGTVYNEMLSSYERPWGNMGRELGIMLYGPGHPLSNESGGYPPAIRTMVPADMRDFIQKNYHISNMGMIVSMDNDIELEDCLNRISSILKRIEPDAIPSVDPATAEDNLPEPRPAATGTFKIASFPSKNEKEPGMMIFAWPPTLKLNNDDEYILELLTGNLAGGVLSYAGGLFDGHNVVLDAEVAVDVALLLEEAGDDARAVFQRDNAAAGAEVVRDVPEDGAAEILHVLDVRLADFSEEQGLEARHALAVVGGQLRQPGGGGTNSGSIQLALAGIPVVSVSVPHRYTHSPVSISRLMDWKNTLSLLHAALKRVTPQLIANR